MDTFRVFILNDEDKIIRSEVLEVASDDEALLQAQSFAAENDLEIWRGQRRIARILKGGDIHVFPDRPK